MSSEEHRTLDIAKGIRVARVMAGYKQKEVVQAIGITQNYLSLLENGHATPSVQLLVTMATIFHVKVSFLLWENGGVIDA